jgi:hypothetical protein
VPFRASRTALAMIDVAPLTTPDRPALVRQAEEEAKGEFRCVQCGYGVVVVRRLPTCPMCGGHEWKATSWHPFTREPAG